MNKLCHFKHTGALVLGMHDALVEITGILAGLAFAITNTRILILTAFVASVSASLSMAAANYMAQRTENNPEALRCALYTGLMYMGTSLVIIAPFCLIANRLWAIGTMVGLAVLIIIGFNLATTCPDARPLRTRLTEMLAVCLGVSIISFLIGLGAKYFLGVNL